MPPKSAKEKKDAEKAAENARQARALADDILEKQRERSGRVAAASSQSSSSQSSSTQPPLRRRLAIRPGLCKDAMQKNQPEVEALLHDDEDQEDIQDVQEEIEMVVESETTEDASGETPKKSTKKKTPGKKTPGKKTPAKKTPAKKTSAKKSPTKKTPTKHQNFSKEMEDKLVAFYRENECLYNKADPDYSNAALKCRLKQDFAESHKLDHIGITGIMFYTLSFFKF